MPVSSNRRIAVSVEAGSRRTFASVLDWPGWCRSGRDEAAALAALRACAYRYAAVAGDAGLTPPDPERLAVVERLSGSKTTDFGAPDALSPRELEPLTPADAARFTSILDACWGRFDRVVASAPAELRKGPRGGGRDRDAIVEHVLATEVELNARKLGLRLPPSDRHDADRIAAQRAAIIAVVLSAGGPAPEAAPAHGWPLRYAVRRIAWHVLDHAWEMEDRSSPDPPG